MLDVGSRLPVDTQIQPFGCNKQLQRPRLSNLCASSSWASVGVELVTSPTIKRAATAFLLAPDEHSLWLEKTKPRQVFDIR